MPNRTRTYRRPGGLAVLVAAATIGLAACSGDSSTPHVASLGTSSSSDGSGNSSTARPTGNPTQLLDEWASCMRGHGDPGQADPVIDANKVIHITLPRGVNLKGQEGARARFLAPCEAYLTAAAAALRGGPAPPPPAQAQLDEYSACMRANGVPNFPDLTENSDGMVHLGFSPGSGLNADSPTFQRADKLCAKKNGVRGIGGTGAPQPGEITYGNSGPGTGG